MPGTVLSVLYILINSFITIALYSRSDYSSFIDEGMEAEREVKDLVQDHIVSDIIKAQIQTFAFQHLCFLSGEWR